MTPRCVLVALVSLILLAGCGPPPRRRSATGADGSAATGGTVGTSLTGGKGGGGMATGGTGSGGSVGGTGGAGEGTGGEGGDGGSADAAAPEPDAGLGAEPDAAPDSEPPSTPPAPVQPIPTAGQLAWHRLALTAFFHFGMNTFTNEEVGDGNANPELFDPTGLDTDQWVSTMKAAGFKQGILVAKHHDGFCLWPTKCSEYSVARSKWMDGKGDVVKAFVDSARAASWRVGLYLSPLDNHPADSSSSPGYMDKFRCWIDELLTNYGKIDEIWFDGNGAPAGINAAFYAHIKQLQPDTVIFAGPEIAAPGVDLRWVGNEGGYAPEGETSVQTLMGKVIWYPSESDTSIRPGWFYHPDDDGAVKSLAQLTDAYFNTVGRNSVLLLNVPPNPTGVLAPQDVARIGQFGASIRNLFTTNLAARKEVGADSTLHLRDYGPQRAVDHDPITYWAAGPGKTSARLEVDLGASSRVRIIDLGEPIWRGERSRKYHVEVQDEGEAGWTTVGDGTAIGQRNLVRLDPPRMARKVALVIEESRGPPAITELGVY